MRRRQQRVTDLVEQLTADRAERRISSVVDILVEEVADGVAHGRAAHQQPEVDGACTVALPAGQLRDLRVGDLVSAKVVATEGVDLIADFVDVVDAVSG